MIKEKDSVLFEQHKQLLQKEKQFTASSKEMDEAKEQEHVLKNDLVQICEALQEVSSKSAMLTRKKEKLEANVARIEIKKRKISAALTSKPSKELVSEMIDELRLSIIDLKEDLQHLESEIAEQATREEQVKQELVKKEEEAKENRKTLEELKKKLSHFSSALDSQKQTFAEDIRQAENRRRQINLLLQEICESLRKITKKSADLAEEKEQLEKEIAKKEKLQQELMSQKALMGGTDILDKIQADYQESIDTNKKRLANVEAKIEKQRAKEIHLKQEVSKKEKELEENHRVVYELKQKHSVICATLEAKRKIFDCQLRQKHQSCERLREERRVSASYVTILFVSYQQSLMFG